MALSSYEAYRSLWSLSISKNSSPKPPRCAMGMAFRMGLGFGSGLGYGLGFLGCLGALCLGGSSSSLPGLLAILI